MIAQCTTLDHTVNQIKLWAFESAVAPQEHAERGMDTHDHLLVFRLGTSCPC
jgi:hypothetical protein